MSSTTQNAVTLKRALGFWQSYGIAVGLVVAATTMVSLANNFGNVGPAFIIPAAVAGVACIFIVMSYAELATAIPGAGMIADYTMPAMGRSMSIFGVLTGYIVLISAGGACESIISGMCAEVVWGVPHKAFAFALLVLFLLINFLGVEFLGKAQIILTVGMMAVLAILGIGGLLQLGTVAEQIPVEFNPYGWGTVATAMLGGIWLYIGIEYVCPMSEEIIQPEKNIPRAMILGVVTIFICDMLFGMAIVRYIPLEEIAGSDIPQLLGAEAMYGTAGVTLLAIATIFAGASSADSHMAAVPRMLYGLARDGMLPKIFAYLHPRFRTPWIAILAAFACLSTPLFINVDISVIMTYVSIACVAWLVSYIMVQVDLIILRKKYPKLHRPFKAPLYPLPQIIGIITCIYTIVTSGSEAIIGAGCFMIVFLIYSILWVKFKMKEKCFTPVPLENMTHITLKFDN